MTEHKTLPEALSAFQAEAPALAKDGVNPHFKSKFTKLDTIRETIGPLLAKHGLAWQTFPCYGSNGEPALRYTLTHVSGDTQSDVMPLGLASNYKPQDLGSAITYARRYSVTAVLDLVADEDDDGNSASRPRESAPKVQSAPSVKLATAADVKEMAAAAKGLEPELVKLALASCGLDGITKFNAVPAEKVAMLVAAFGGAQS